MGLATRLKGGWQALSSDQLAAVLYEAVALALCFCLFLFGLSLGPDWQANWQGLLIAVVFVFAFLQLPLTLVILVVTRRRGERADPNVWRKSWRKKLEDIGETIVVGLFLLAAFIAKGDLWQTGFSPRANGLPGGGTGASSAT